MRLGRLFGNGHNLRIRPIGNADHLSSLSAYKLRNDSPLVNRGSGQPGTLLSVVKLDFYGGSALMGGKFDIGVDELA